MSATITVRSKEEISRLVKQRVQERNSWLVNGVKEPPVTTRQTLKFVCGTLPKMMMLKFDSDELDKTFPVRALDFDKLKQPAKDRIQVTWLGHASMLVQMNGCNFITDPVFSDRCSPSQWFGPKRYRKPPCSLQELCQHISIDSVLISHNHYDHLDQGSIEDLIRYAPNARYVVPLGLREWFNQAFGKDTFQRLDELDWHETTHYDDEHRLTITSIPMRHWSNRNGDRDQTLWCGYVVQTCSTNNNKPLRFLFPGDTAWFDQLEDLGKQYGPFDVAAIPIGAYEPRDFMKHSHINVEEAVRMKDAVQAIHAVPIHWGTFPLTTEPVIEPRDKLIGLMAERPDKESFVPWLIGETREF
jgi:N-acyl-phosphatidylethanolamine-hydrolysing phospholipase D